MSKVMLAATLCENGRSRSDQSHEYERQRPTSLNDSGSGSGDKHDIQIPRLLEEPVFLPHDGIFFSSTQFQGERGTVDPVASDLFIEMRILRQEGATHQQVAALLEMFVVGELSYILF